MPTGSSTNGSRAAARACHGSRLVIEAQSFAGCGLQRPTAGQAKAADFAAGVVADADFCFAAGRKLAVVAAAAAVADGGSNGGVRGGQQGRQHEHRGGGGQQQQQQQQQRPPKDARVAWLSTSQLAQHGLVLAESPAGGGGGGGGEWGVARTTTATPPAGPSAAAAGDTAAADAAVPPLAPVYVLGQSDDGRWKCAVDATALPPFAPNDDGASASSSAAAADSNEGEPGSSASGRGSTDGAGAGGGMAAWQAHDLRALMPVLPAGELAAAGRAVALVSWHQNHRYCSVCGAPSAPVEGGAKRQCSRSPRHRHYPRVDPVVIALVENASGTHALLGRSRGMRPGMYTCLSGFLEQGESIEEAIAREVQEESGVTVARVDVIASQPWPIGRGGSHELMIGAIARAAGPDSSLCVNTDEMDDVRWVSWAELAQAFPASSPLPSTTVPVGSDSTATPGAAADAGAGAGGGSGGGSGGAAASEPFLHPHGITTADGLQFHIPPPLAVAHHLIRAWVLRGGNWFASRL